jgi:hypothetical protein
MSPRWGSTPRLTDRLTVGRNVTLTQSVSIRAERQSVSLGVRAESVKSVLSVKQWQSVLKVKRPYGVGRRATSEDTVRRLGKYYSELRV